MTQTEARLIEAGFPCHQVGAETQREQSVGLQPPNNRLHVWWARRPLTPSRAAVLASFLPADTDPVWFVRHLGIEKVQAMVNGVRWTLTEDTHLARITVEGDQEVFTVNRFAVNWLKKEQDRRKENRAFITSMIEKDASLSRDPVVEQWQKDSEALPEPLPTIGEKLPVHRVAADPAHVNERLVFANSERVKKIVGGELRWGKPDLYGYDRAYTHHPDAAQRPLVVLDPTAGGGSIPFEALRLGHRVIANELNPVATVILYATLDYPARFGASLAGDIQKWGQMLVSHVSEVMADLTPFSPLPESERQCLRDHCKHCPEVVPTFDVPEVHQTGLLFVRQIRCPHCQGEAPLLNSSWLCKQGVQCGIRIVTDGRKAKGTVTFEPYRISEGKGPNGEDPDFATVAEGIGTCIHCRQQIGDDTEGNSEIKLQAAGISKFGKWKDRLFCVVGVRYQPKLDSHGKIQLIKSGDNAGQIKTEKVTFYRAPNATDEAALKRAEQRLAEQREALEAAGALPTEKIPAGYETTIRWPLDQYGLLHWTDMFTPRQLLGHATLIQHLKHITPAILSEHGLERGKAIVTYLQFAIDKSVDYNSRLTRWHYGRAVLVNTFGRHNFSIKWTFGEMVFSGENSGFRWALKDVYEAYRDMAKLVEPLHDSELNPPVQIINGTAAHIPQIGDKSVDLICMDPPYYDNVLYAELSDYFYVWQKRTLKDLYPDLFSRQFTDKKNEAVANPSRDGSREGAKAEYKRLMEEIFKEGTRVLKDDGVMTLMFTHKSQDAWETLTQSLIDQKWVITSAFPVESEGENSTHQQEVAAAASTIFLTCRKRLDEVGEPSTWTGIGGTGVQQRIQSEVRIAMKEFEKLHLNPVDEMVAGYGRALRVLSMQWPVLDGDEQVSPLRAMTEASRVVAQYQITRLTGGRLQVDDLIPEAAIALTLYGIYGLNEIKFDDFKNLCNSLNADRRTLSGGYTVEGRMVGINADAQSRRRSGASQDAEAKGYHAPLVSKGNKLRLAKPSERNAKRLEDPQTEWDILHGLLDANTRGELVVARDYLNDHAPTANRREIILDLLTVWAKEMPDEKLRRDAETLLFGLKS